MPTNTTVPYEHSHSGLNAREEIKKMLQKFGCTSITFAEKVEYSTVNESHTLLLLFCFNAINIKMEVSGQGWANFYLRKKPYSNRTRSTRKEYEQKALKQGAIAINSLLRDWVKSQLTLIESQLMTFEEAFLPHMQTPTGLTVSEVFLNNNGNDLSNKLLALPGA